MPSTAWNVFVASGVAVVVYLGVRMGRVLPALVAGTMLFIGGWMTGYAINQGAPISIPRMLIAGGICGFVIVWTLLITQGDYLLGGAVIALVSFAAWFTSEMGPIKSETGPMAAIDEPKPPEGPRPGTPVDLGGDAEPSTGNDAGSRGNGVLGGLRDLFTPSEADAPEPPGSPGPDGPSEEELKDHAPENGEEDPTYSTRKPEPEERAGGGKESIFGLGIFYEGDPNGPTPAGAGDTGSTATEPKNADHTRPGATGEPADNGRSADDPVRVEVDPDEGGDQPTAAENGAASRGESAPAEEHGVGSEPAAEPEPEPEPEEASPIRRLREPLNSPRRAGKSPEVESVDPHGGAGDAATNAERADGGSPEESVTDRSANAEGRADAANDGSHGDAASDESGAGDEPPEEHRVEIEDDGGFMFG